MAVGHPDLRQASYVESQAIFLNYAEFRRVATAFFHAYDGIEELFGDWAFVESTLGPTRLELNDPPGPSFCPR